MAVQGRGSRFLKGAPIEVLDMEVLESRGAIRAGISPSRLSETSLSLSQESCQRGEMVVSTGQKEVVKRCKAVAKGYKGVANRAGTSATGRVYAEVAIGGLEGGVRVLGV